MQPSAVNTVGISTISLRGFGPNRSLVLIDGHRTTPVNALMVTDINSIPGAMIDRVEIITGGASAVYGADAFGGVTNFIMKKNYEGAQIDVQDGISQAGDGNETARVDADGHQDCRRPRQHHHGPGVLQPRRVVPEEPQLLLQLLERPEYLGDQQLLRDGRHGGLLHLGATPSAAAENVTFAQRIAAGGSPYSYGAGTAFSRN